MEFQDFFKSKLSYYGGSFAKEQDMEWITVRGNHIPVKPGQSKETAVKEFLNSHKGSDTKKKLGTQKAKTHSDFEGDKGLSEKNKKVEKKAFDRVLKHEDQILADYKKENGNIVNTDNFRPFFKPDGYNGSNAAAVQEPSSYLAKRAYTEGLKNKGEHVFATAGGSGAGKSSAINSVKNLKKLQDGAAVVLDSNFSNHSSAVKKIREAHEAGKKFVASYIYRDPEEAFENGVVKRMLHNEKEMGRIVPNHVTAENHIGSWETAQKLHEEGVDGKKIAYHFIDNSLGAGNAKKVPYQQLKEKIKFPSHKELLEKFNKRTKELYTDGIISKEQYEEYTASPE